MSAGAIADLRGQAEAAATDPRLDGTQRAQKLRLIRRRVADLLGEVDRYMADAGKLAQAETVEESARLLRAREDADLREELIRRGLAGEEELDEAGLISHAEIAALEEEGLLAEALNVYSERLHPRDRTGKWRETLGALLPSPQPAKPTGAGDPGSAVAPQRPMAAHQPGSEGMLAMLREAGVDEDVMRRIEELHLAEPREARKGKTARKLLGLAKDTRDLHRDPDSRQYHPLRKELHDQIVDVFLREKKPVWNGKFVEWKPDPDGEYVLPNTTVYKRLMQLADDHRQEAAEAGEDRQEELQAIATAYERAAEEGRFDPRATFLAGGNASGKSTVLYSPEQRGVDVATPGPHNVEINFDLIKEMLPEFEEMARARDPYATDGTHFESADIARRLMEEANGQGLSVIVDASGNSSGSGYVDMIKKHKALGYRTEVLMVDAPFALAVEGMVKRGDKTGRYVPLPIMARVHRNSVARHNEWRYAKELDEWAVWRRNDDGSITLAAQGRTGEMKVMDEEAYAAVRGKAPGGRGTGKDVGRRA